MFDKQISSKTNAIFGAIKTGAKLVGGALLENGLDKLRDRSPLAAKIISKVENVRAISALKDKQLEEFLKESPKATKHNQKHIINYKQQNR